MFDPAGEPISTETIRHIGDDDLLAGLEELARRRRDLDAAEMALLAEVHHRGLTDERAGHRTGIWYGLVTKGSAADAKRRVKVATACRSRFERFAAAIGEGVISHDHCAAVVRAANPRIIEQLVGLQDELLAIAEHSTFQQFKRELDGIATLLDQDGGYDPAADIGANRLSITPAIEGITAFGGELVGDHAEIFRQAIETRADRLYKRFVADAEQTDALDIPGRPTLRALALIEICREADSKEPSSTTPARPEMTLRLQAENLDRLETLDGATLPAQTAKRLLCDPVLHPVILGNASARLHAGRATRLVSPAQRRVLAERDRGCVFPGCDAPTTWCDAHHIEHWRDGGKTDVENLALLCRHHHGVTHRKGWRMTRGPDADGTENSEIREPNRFRWHTPNGDVLDATLHAGNSPP